MFGATGFSGHALETLYSMGHTMVMVEPEKYAVKRDVGWLWRLVLGLLFAVLVGGYLFAKITDPETTGCATRSLDRTLRGDPK